MQALGRSGAKVAFAAAAGAAVGSVVGAALGGPIGAAVGASVVCAVSTGATYSMVGSGYVQPPYRLFSYIRENAQSEEVRRAFGGKAR